MSSVPSRPDRRDRVAVVTGSGSGIGEAIARRLAADGTAVVINDVNAARAEAVAEQIRAAGGRASAVVADVTSPGEVTGLIDSAVAEWGGLDILVNNAGIGGNAALRNIDETTWQRVLDINLNGVFHGCQAAAGIMRERGFGRIVNISSRAWLGWWGQASYASSKGGVVSLTRALAVEFAKYDVTVNCIAPGLIDTPLLRSEPDEMLADLQHAQPTRKIGTADDVAHLTRFLVDERARAVTGQVVYCCGGKSIFAMPARRGARR